MRRIDRGLQDAWVHDMQMIEKAAPALEVRHRGARPTHKAHFIEPVLVDEMQCCHGVAMPGAEVEQPMSALGNLPPASNLDHCKIGRVETNAVLACEAPARRRPGIGEPVHHRCHVATTRAPHETHGSEFVVLDDLEDAVRFGLDATGVDQPVVALDHLPTATELRHRQVGTIEGDAIFRNPWRSDFADAVAGDSQAGPLRVVPETVLAHDVFGVRGRLQGVVTVGHGVNDDVLARKPAAVDVGPTRRDPLVGVAVRKPRARARVGPDAFYVDRAERLLVADRGQRACRVEEQELVEIAQVVVAVTGRPDEQIGTRCRAADHEIGIAGVVRQKVETHDAMRARRHAAILYVMVVGREGLRADREVANPRDEIDAHESLLCRQSRREPRLVSAAVFRPE